MARTPVPADTTDAPPGGPDQPLLDRVARELRVVFRLNIGVSRSTFERLAAQRVRAAAGRSSPR